MKTIPFAFIMATQLIGLQVLAQYTYFNSTYEGPYNPNLLSISVFCQNGQYIVINDTSIDGIEVMMFSKLDSEGNIVSFEYTPFENYTVYEGGSSHFTEYTSGIAWAGSLEAEFAQTIAIAVWYDPVSFMPIWSHLFEELNDSLTASEMDKLVLAQDGTFWACGNLKHNTDEDPWPEEFSTYVCRLSEDGNVDAAWQFYTAQEEYDVLDIITLDNGKLLIGGIVSQNSISDHFCLLFNPITGLIEDVEIWGSQWDESGGILRGMSNGNFYYVYDFILESDGEFQYPEQLTECRIRQIDPNTLDAISEFQVQLLVLGDLNEGFWIGELFETIDGGYALYFAHKPLNSPGGTYFNPNIVKLDDEFEIEWTKEYQAPVEYNIKGISDMAIACDGGFICTGTLLTDSQQLQWTFKTDACGELEAMGCPPVGLDEVQPGSEVVHIWPNPAKENLFVKGTEGYITSFHILDATGRPCLTDALSGSSVYVSLLASGLYSIVLSGKNGERVLRRFVKE